MPITKRAIDSDERANTPSAKPPNRIRELRNAREWSMDELARRAKTDRQRIFQLEHGNTRLNDVWMQRLAAAFNIKPADLLIEEDRGYVLDDFEQRMIDQLRSLTEERRQLLPQMIELLVASSGR